MCHKAQTEHRAASPVDHHAFIAQGDPVPSSAATLRDEIDHVIEQWGRERPDLDVSPVAVIGRISRISRSFERAIEKTFERYGLTSAGFYVLAALRRSGPPYRMSPTQLHSSLLVSGGTMTHRIDRLEAAGFVVRGADPDDGRGTLVALTDHGRDLADRLIEAHNLNEHKLLQSLTTEERDELADLLRKLLMAGHNPQSTGAAGG